MKLSFVDVRYKAPIVLPESFLSQLPKKVIFFLNIQFHHQYEALKEQLSNSGVTVATVRPKHAWHDGQILGCSVEDWTSEEGKELVKMRKDVKADDLSGVEGFVYVGDGLFHPKAILFKNDLPVYIYDPKTQKSRTLTKADIEQIIRARKAGLSAFYAATNVGVIVTTKYGQTRLKQVMKLEEKYPEKKFYYLLADVIDFSKLEDFAFLESFVNTACPRIMDDNEKVFKPMVNMEDLGIVW
jgi:diphthamide biosynthesis enzyme Dph1/Dph2-like protein